MQLRGRPRAAAPASVFLFLTVAGNCPAAHGGTMSVDLPGRLAISLPGGPRVLVGVEAIAAKPAGHMRYDQDPKEKYGTWARVRQFFVDHLKPGGQ